MEQESGTEILDSLEKEEVETIAEATEVEAEARSEGNVEEAETEAEAEAEAVEEVEAVEEATESSDVESVQTSAEVEVALPETLISNAFEDEPDADVVDAETGVEDSEGDDLDDHFAVEEQAPPMQALPKETDVDVAAEITQISFEVRTPAGKKFPLKNVHLDSTLLEVKHMVAKMDGSLQPHEMKIIKSGKPITDNQKTIREYDIKEKQVLHVVKVLFGANPTGASGVGIRREKTEEHERGFLKVTIPQGARPGNRLIIQPPGRPRMHIIVPRGYQPGMILNVKLPEEVNEPRDHIEQSTQPLRNGNNRSVASSTSSQPGRGNGGSTLMKVQCPRNCRPGSEIKIMVPGKGQMKVQVPANAAPGQFFYFRVMNSY
mmetsp:Transcript_10605/g.13299  ORF Transcript_10605/g.13299 Transcript_10605/m.13299 type:complete len:376 (-) Transcript_10605:208-1335(-)|eukprot:CAMPEP_0204830038 /NCGR_PEP_ID=MMETSP1346-20131115/8297_1 /ASSEMBLY_ACC=CAM_ASM_000771 /TAXON_ID=215587 /ORGANISM="Aplanochytrium stocchinoi, Strain GSBS06" /LENGTH=375 /DNA_ID=CAMNT_0051960159 /DNA_START=237 /DNA_END=1364 /DNA_ORIENTATION=-